MNDLFEEKNNETFRHQCELRWLAGLVLPERRKYLELAEKMRGSKARKRLEEGLMELWQKR
jgi:hypothetical protein